MRGALKFVLPRRGDQLVTGVASLLQAGETGEVQVHSSDQEAVGRNHFEDGAA